ncbi:HNH endonuclease signature motif containing protein [uncultured Modestobacter sp.]|uniref:HNH endonuclease signature motif containing protein n=1 Tax=uncultured Modestobacter sp. TaxID=380048 RepID=UPI00262F4509|nr:HNH endonuclease signature motif containing protein [uncultured Modestobacter sp.]
MTTTAVPPGPHGGVIDIVWVGAQHTAPDHAAWSDERLATGLRSVQRRRARLAAEEADLILGMAGHRPANDDPPVDSPGTSRPGWTSDAGDGEISEFFVGELSAVLNLGRGTAAVKLRRALIWAQKLPATFAALRAGDLDERRAQQLADTLAHTNPTVAGQIEDQLLAEARDLSVARLDKRATELMLQLDAAAAEERRSEAEKTTDVRVYPSPTDGRSTLAADLSTDEAVECHDLVDQLATMLKADGDPRPIGALRAHVLSALIRRPADSGLPEVAANLTITADLSALEGTSSTTGEVNGLAITAAHLRDLLARVGALGLTTPDGGTLSYALAGPDGQLLATVTPAELARLARRGCPDHPGAACDCPVLGPPPPTSAYTPTARQRAFVTTRDRRCRFPNCGQRVGFTDLDHVTAHACGGVTDCTNLCCLCRSHHRLKTFAPGWRFHLDGDGTLHVTTPSGVTRTTRPPGLRRPPPEPAGPLIPEPLPPDDQPPPF